MNTPAKYRFIISIILLYGSNAMAQSNGFTSSEDPFYDYYQGDYAFLGDSILNQGDTISIRSDFADKVEIPRRTEDYKFLRAYKNKKETLIRLNEKALSRYQRLIYDLGSRSAFKENQFKYSQNLLLEVNSILMQSKGSTLDTSTFALRRLGFGVGPFKRSDLIASRNNIIVEQNNRRESIKKDSTSRNQIVDVYKKLTRNKQNMESDLDECITAIDVAIAPEYKNQNFKRQISVAFSILIGVLIIIFFLIVYYRSDNSISHVLLSDGGLQFVTIFVLIIAVILFGVLDILKSNELSAILSGIAGYILGKNGKLSLSQPASNLAPRDQSITSGQNIVGK